MGLSKYSDWVIEVYLRCEASTFKEYRAKSLNGSLLVGHLGGCLMVSNLGANQGNLGLAFDFFLYTELYNVVILG